ncbi:hypothetical protein BKA70DRAFT_1417081 [Coprinopsis sp. MPI-PUGE-AT-0042]|nr:hypothetical protein BKA70DRAFT_1417081 [Coprinopsis sp. MPI-PUGE-AT-0042]
MFSLKIRKLNQTPPGDNVEFDLTDAAHSGERQVDLPCPWAAGAISYTTTPSPAGSVAEMNEARSHSINLSDAVTVASPGTGAADMASSLPVDVTSSSDTALVGPSVFPQPDASADATQLPTYRRTSSLLNPSRPDQ